MSHCACPTDGSYYCAQCLRLAARAGLTLLPPEGRAVPTMPHYDTTMLETPLQVRLRDAAIAAGYLYYHTHSSKKSDPGWPDTAIIHPDGGPLFLWELKRQDQSAQPSPAQRRWLDALAKATNVHSAVFRPSDWQAMLRLLQREPAPPASADHDEAP